MKSSEKPASPTHKVRLSSLPEQSLIVGHLPGSHFADCYQFADQWPELDALATILAVTSRMPSWMSFLMAVRNQAVRLVGLKHLGAIKTGLPAKSARDYRVGERVGIFTLEQVQANEAIVGDNDKHLHVRLSLLKHRLNGEPVVSLSTVVHVHNTLGHVYMAVVGPVHKLIVPLMLAQVTRG